MRSFSKQETKVVIGIFVVIFTLSFFNFRLALRRSRDAQRKSDMGNYLEGLDNYKKRFGHFPQASADGKIVACATNDTQQYVDAFAATGKYDFALYLQSLRPCEWGEDILIDPFHKDATPFMKSLLPDPYLGEGISYVYQSSGGRFQILAHLEGKDSEDEYLVEVEARGVSCGTEICNYARSSKDTPLNVSIEEYEQSLAIEEEKARKALENE